ncbi:copper resistance CopC family protein [Corynebacterium flavescens]|uniref:copper resistance CopC family protein n=1 Tax=Corynebacterium flavescens TaxID=28028 RepID=UPI000ED78047|nr:copper resistance protein CopC [Corynebacterium sp. UBA5992]HCG45896.1 copper resistance protein [Corynebacterium flavescens]
MALSLRSLFRAVTALAAALLLMVGVAPQALAHDSVVGGSVKEGEVLDSFPREITLEFSGIPKEGFITFALTNTDTGEVIFTEEPAADGRELKIETPEGVDPGPGNYQVGFQITSSDGHATRGSITFEVAGASAVNDAASASAQPADSGSATADPELSGALKFIIAVGGVLALLAVVAMLFMKFRKNEEEG